MAQQRPPTVKRIKSWFNLDQYSRNPDKDAQKVKDLLKNAGFGYNVDAERTIAQVNKIVNGHGVESLRGNKRVDPYFDNTVALYVNMGDSYAPTLLYETETGKWRLTTWADWVEKHDRKYKISQVIQY